LEKFSEDKRPQAEKGRNKKKKRSGKKEANDSIPSGDIIELKKREDQESERKESLFRN